MISREEAKDLILKHKPKARVIKKDLSSSLFSALAWPLLSQRCQPPFDRVMMDGIAINFSDLEAGQKTFSIQAFQGAGTPALHLNPNMCIEVSTGAVLPQGCDVVVPYEDIQIIDRKATVKSDVKIKQFIHIKGSDYPQGHLLLEKFTLIGPQELALLASNGLNEVEVMQKPKIALISTGDELVVPGSNVKDHEIYRSNIYGLDAMLRSHHFSENEFFHLKDVKDEMLQIVRQILDQFDVLVFSGGVSKGKKDFLPEVLRELGIEEVFHRVNQRPGKPMWYGERGEQQIFGLPGNPVSTQVTLRDYVIPSLWQQVHQRDQEIQIQLSGEVEIRGAMTHYIPARIEMRQNQLFASPVKINTSGDFHSLSQTSGMLILDNRQSQNVFKAESFQSYRFWAKVF